MAFKYQVRPNCSDQHSVSHWWCALVVRMGRLKTFDQDLVTSDIHGKKLDISLQAASDDPVAERAPLFLSSPILSWTTTEMKSSHVSSCALRLAPVARFDRLICAGDWVFLWAFDNREDYLRVARNIRTLVSSAPSDVGPEVVVNGFNDGLRFVGRCNAPKEEESIQPESGIRQISYDLTAVGFSEFDAKIYYTQAYTARYDEIKASMLAQLNDLATNIDQHIADGLPIKTAVHQRLWLQIFLGAGPGITSKGFDPRAAKQIVGPQFAQEVESSLVQSPNDTYLVPRTAGLILGINPGPMARPKYVDVLSCFVGVQGFGFGAEDFLNGPDAAAQLAPVSIDDPTGSFRPQFQAFDGGSVWDLLARYSNQPINEQFTCLRADNQGRIRPTYILRQSPFSSKRGAEEFSRAGLPATAFADLPRWQMDRGLVLHKKTGPSDSLRVNYVAVQGSDVIGETAVQQTLLNQILAPPMADIADIKRNGLRPFVRTINADVTGAVEGGGHRGRFYTAFMADILFPGHLKFSGSLLTHGIQLPVAIGDNLEYDGVIYQIEGRIDSGSIDGSGHKAWRTNFQLVNGISAATDLTDNDVYPHEAIADQLLKTPDLTASSDERDPDLEGVIDFAREEAALREEFSSKPGEERWSKLKQEGTVQGTRGFTPLI